MRPTLTREQRQAAKAAGYRSGWLDQRIGRKLESSWLGVTCDPHGSYGYLYGLGYRDGWNNAAANPEAYFAREGHAYIDALPQAVEL